MAALALAVSFSMLNSGTFLAAATEAPQYAEARTAVVGRIVFTVLGDLNPDSSVDAQDLRLVAGNLGGLLLQGDVREAYGQGDVNLDGRVDVPP